MASRGQRRLPGERGVVVDRVDGQRPGKRALGTRVVGRVAGGSGPLNVCGAQRRPGRPVTGNEAQVALKIADRPGRHVLSPGRAGLGRGRTRGGAPEHASGDQRRSRQQSGRGRRHHHDRRDSSSFPHLVPLPVPACTRLFAAGTRPDGRKPVGFLTHDQSPTPIRTAAAHEQGDVAGRQPGWPLHHPRGKS